MSIFGRRKETSTTTPEITSGREALRLKTLSRLRRANLVRTSNDLGIGLAQLEAFARGTGQLSTAQLQALTKEYYHHAAYDEQSDRLIDTAPEPVSFGKPPEPYKNPDPAVRAAQEAYHAAIAAATPPPVTRTPVSDVENAGRFAKRPGFAE